MKTVDEQLQDSLDEVAKSKGAKTASLIWCSEATAEEKLVLSQEVLSGKFAESVPAWRRPASQSKLVEEIRESLGIEREEPRTVRKRNGAADNGPVREASPADKSKQNLIESLKHMGMSQREAELFAEDGDSVDTSYLFSE